MNSLLEELTVHALSLGPLETQISPEFFVVSETCAVLSM
jgi:hypothetical protein